MKKRPINKKISSENLAAYLDGNTTPQESQEILNAIAQDAELRELLHISQSVDAELGFSQDIEFIPMSAIAATCDNRNHCCLECEKYILDKIGIKYDEKQLLKNAIQNGWQKEEGTALHNIGRHLEAQGLLVARRYKCDIATIIDALNADKNIIAVVDGGELTGDLYAEKIEDTYTGPIPDHTVVILAINQEEQTITLHDPASAAPQDTYPIEQFTDAWNDSKNYLVIASNKAEAYTPHPIDLSDVELSADLNELREAIAENAHDVWAAERQAQGWTYGPTRNDEKKQTPCMVAYSLLPESEKKFDREMAMNTLKLLRKLGYDIVKRKK